jgi:hypothetical protein
MANQAFVVVVRWAKVHAQTLAVCRKEKIARPKKRGFLPKRRLICAGKKLISKNKSSPSFPSFFHIKNYNSWIFKELSPSYFW